MSGPILITETYHPLLFEGLEQLGLVWHHLPNPTSSAVQTYLSQVTGWILRGAIPVTESLLAQAPHLRFIIRPGSGVDHLDIDALQRRNVALYTTPQANAAPVAEYVLATLLMLTRQLYPGALAMRTGQWSRKAHTGHELSSLTVGIIGFGHNGSLTARLLSQMGARVLAYDRYKGGFGGQGVEETTLEYLFQEAQAVSFHVPLTPLTRGWANRDFWSRFRHPVWVINAARGEILVLADLVWALEHGQVLGAALDVLPQEPPIHLPPSEAQALRTLQQHPRIILTPHIAGLTHDSEKRLAKATLAILRTLNKPSHT